MNETIGPVVWLKDKHSRPKDKGRYKGGTSATAKKNDRKRKKVGGGPSPTERVKVLTSDGSVTWLTRPRETGRR